MSMAYLWVAGGTSIALVVALIAAALFEQLYLEPRQMVEDDEEVDMDSSIDGRYTFPPADLAVDRTLARRLLAKRATHAQGILRTREGYGGLRRVFVDLLKVKHPLSKFYFVKAASFRPTVVVFVLFSYIAGAYLINTVFLHSSTQSARTADLRSDQSASERFADILWKGLLTSIVVSVVNTCFTHVAWRVRPKGVPPSQQRDSAVSRSVLSRKSVISLAVSGVGDSSPTHDVESNTRRLTFTAEEMHSIAQSEVQVQRYVGAVCTVMTAKLYENGVLPYDPNAVPRSVVRAGDVSPSSPRRKTVVSVDRDSGVPGSLLDEATVESILGYILFDSCRSVVQLAIREAERHRPIWRLATEAVVLKQFRLASALFVADVCIANPDLFFVLCGFSPPRVLDEALDVFIRGRHVGKEWARYYAASIHQISDERTFLRMFEADEVHPLDLRCLLMRSREKANEQAPTPLGSAALSDENTTQMLLSTTITNLNVEELEVPIEEQLTWTDGVEAICQDRDFVRGSHIFRAADHPNRFSQCFPVFDDNVLPFFNTLEYGRLVARFYAIHQLGITGLEFSAEYIEEEGEPIVLPSRLFYLDTAQTLSTSGTLAKNWSTRNAYLSYLVNYKLTGEVGQILVQSDKMTPTELEGIHPFAYWLSSRPGANILGTGSVLSPMKGLEAAVNEARTGDVVVLMAGIYSPVAIRGIHADSDKLLVLRPRHYVARAGADMPHPHRASYDTVIFENRSGMRAKHNYELLKFIDCENIVVEGISFRKSRVAVESKLSRNIFVRDCIFQSVATKHDQIRSYPEYIESSIHSEVSKSHVALKSTAQSAKQLLPSFLTGLSFPATLSYPSWKLLLVPLAGWYTLCLLLCTEVAGLKDFETAKAEEMVWVSITSIIVDSTMLRPLLYLLWASLIVSKENVVPRAMLKSWDDAEDDNDDVAEKEQAIEAESDDEEGDDEA